MALKTIQERILEGVEADSEFPTPRKRNHALLETFEKGKDCIKKVKASADDINGIKNENKINPGVQAENEHKEFFETARKKALNDSSVIEINLEILEPKLEEGKLLVKKEDGVKKKILPGQADVKKEPVEDEQDSEVLNQVVKAELMASAADDYQIKTENCLIKEVKLESNEIKVKIEPVEIKDCIEQKDADDRKLFVGGLPQEANSGDIRDHFEKFGELEEVILKKDPHTGRSRGFAFMTFTTAEGFGKALVTKSQELLGKNISIEKAEVKQGKIYVGKIPEEISSEEIKSHFSNFGTITLFEQPVDNKAKKVKNFCFITFVKEASAKQLIKMGSTTINGFQVDVKKVTPQKLVGPVPLFGSRQFFGGWQKFGPEPYVPMGHFGRLPWANY